LPFLDLGNVARCSVSLLRLTGSRGNCSIFEGDPVVYKRRAETGGEG
jgi:hypothetical protein